jgi:hypothetical protein
MVVSQHVSPVDDSSPVTKQWLVEGGVCGFAWVVIRPANCPFANWMKTNKGARKAYGGGLSYWVHDFDQSMERKLAYAHAFATILHEFGIDANAQSRMD